MKRFLMTYKKIALGMGKQVFRLPEFNWKVQCDKIYRFQKGGHPKNGRRFSVIFYMVNPSPHMGMYMIVHRCSTVGITLPSVALSVVEYESPSGLYLNVNAHARAYLTPWSLDKTCWYDRIRTQVWKPHCALLTNSRKITLFSHYVYRSERLLV